MPTIPDLAALCVPDWPQFHQHADADPTLKRAAEVQMGPTAWRSLGTSEASRPISGYVFGRGPHHVSLIAGAHADEPVGPETLRAFVRAVLAESGPFKELLAAFTFYVVPHMNPDGEAANRAWIDAWPDVEAFIRWQQREVPGRDLEFGFPDMRPENRAVRDFLAGDGPFALHMSLHGMAFAEGVLLLIERGWAGRVDALKTGWQAALAQAGLGIHDHDRGGDKGFDYLGPGFTTTPRGRAMQAYFRDKGDAATAARFHLSSMEFVRSLGGDPLSLVTEIPLFTLPQTRPSAPGVPATYLAWKNELPEVRLRLQRSGDASEQIARFAPTPVPLRTAMRLQFEALRLGLQQVLDAPKGDS